MKKYIDAEKLKSIIKAQIKERKEWMKDIDRSDRQDQLWSDLNGEDMSILQIIDSLQQEQQENKPNLLKSLEEYFEKTPKEQLDADWEKLKVWNEIGPDAETYCKMLREQQEADLDEEMDRFFEEMPIQEHENIFEDTYKMIARHFYEFCKNKMI